MEIIRKNVASCCAKAAARRSVPIIADIKHKTGLDSVMFGLFLPEDNLHAPNESFNLDVMKKGIETTRRMPRRQAASWTLKVPITFVRKVTSSVTRPGRG